MRYRDGLAPHTLASVYALLGWALGLILCVSPSIAANAVGVLLLGHAMVIAAYMVHECAHNTVFKQARHNAWLGGVLLWVTGASYSPFQQIRHKHMRHHVDRADVVAWDYRRWLEARPALLRLARELERIGIPAIEIALRCIAIVAPFREKEVSHLRGRVLLVLLARVGGLVLLASISPRVLILYPIAYMLSLQVLRYMDAHQHTYDLRDDLHDADAKTGPAPGLDRAFEDRNTFSNPLSERWPMLNLLVLNFGFHNAHHRKPTEPWYRLPRLHAEHYGAANPQALAPEDVRHAFRQWRAERILNADAPDIGVSRTTFGRFIGVDGVSFLVPY